MTTKAGRLLAILAFACCSCTSAYPTPAPGDRISGHVWYHGNAQLAMKRPALRVMLFVDFPPTGDVFGLVTIENPNLATGVSYALDWLTPYQYKVVGQLIDLDMFDADPTQLPAGGFPDFCTLMRPGEGLVNVTPDAPTTGIDFTIYDQAGALDPCAIPVTVCPLPGKASMNLVVRSSRTPTPNDQLRVALFQTFPSMNPTSSHMIPGGSLVFPQTIIDNGLPGGDYKALYVCFDLNSNSGMGLCTSEDAYVLYLPSAPITMPPDKIVNLLADLDASTVVVTSVDDPVADGCP
jgi:hypothetical protein